MSDYNGWTNRATWLINVWFEPESREQVSLARETFEEAVSELASKNAWLSDFIDTDINWTELESHFEAEGEPDEEFFPRPPRKPFEPSQSRRNK